VIATFLLNFVLAAVGLSLIVAPLAVYGLRELAPATQPRPVFASAGGGWS
jgi:hypothetical protein